MWGWGELIPNLLKASLARGFASGVLPEPRITFFCPPGETPGETEGETEGEIRGGGGGGTPYDSRVKNRAKIHQVKHRCT